MNSISHGWSENDGMQQQHPGACSECTNRCMKVHGRSSNSTSRDEEETLSFFKIMIGSFRTTLFIPPKFGCKIENLEDQKAYLEDSEGNLWKVKVSRIKNSLAFHQGWDEFVKDHNIGIGELIVFKYVGSSKFVLHIFSISGCDRLHFCGKKNHDIKRKGYETVQSMHHTSVNHSPEAPENFVDEDLREKKKQKTVVAAPIDSVAQEGGMGSRDTPKSQDTDSNMAMTPCRYKSEEKELCFSGMGLRPGPGIVTTENEVEIPLSLSDNCKILVTEHGTCIIHEENEVGQPDLTAIAPLYLDDNEMKISGYKADYSLLTNQTPSNHRTCSKEPCNSSKVECNSHRNLQMPAQKIEEFNPLVGSFSKGNSDASSAQNGPHSTRNVLECYESPDGMGNDGVPSAEVGPSNTMVVPKCHENHDNMENDDAPCAENGSHSTTPFHESHENCDAARHSPHFVTSKNHMEGKEDACAENGPCNTTMVPECHENRGAAGMSSCPFVLEDKVKKVETKMKETTLAVVKMESVDLIMPPPNPVKFSFSVTDSAQPWHELSESLPSKRKRNERKVVLFRDSVMQVWPVLYHESGKFIGFLGGWQAFSSAHNLQEGDVCMLEMVNESESMFEVLISRK